MTNTARIKRPATAEIVALDDLYDALCSFRDSDKLTRTGMDAALSKVLRNSLAAVFSGNMAVASTVLRYLDERPHATMRDAIGELCEAAG